MDEIQAQIIDNDGVVLHDFISGVVFARNIDWDAAVCTILYAVDDDDGDFDTHRLFLQSLGVWQELVSLNARFSLLAPPLYFRWAEPGEGATSAQITRIVAPDRKDYLVVFELTAFEDTESTAVSAAGLLTIGDSVALPAGGSLPGRFASIDIVHNALTIPTRWWLGVKPLQSGAVGSTFDPLWDLSDGDVYGLSGVYVGADAHGGTAVQLTHVVAPLSAFVVIGPTHVDAAADYGDFAGSYTPLLRCNIPAGTAVTITVGAIDLASTSPSGLENTIFGSVYAVGTGGLWNTIPLPVVSLPGWYDSNDFDSTAVFLEFSWSAGVGDIVVDTVSMVPFAAHAHLERGVDANAELDRPDLRVQTNERGVVSAGGFLAGSQFVRFAAGVRRFEVPVGGGILVVAGGTPWAYSPTQDFDLSCSIEPRWANYS